MKVVLVLPNFDAPLGVSLGLSSIAAVLRRGGHEVAAIHITEWLDRPWELASVLEEVRTATPALVGISTGFNHYPEMRELARAVESELACPVVMGGIHPTLNARAVLADVPELSFVNVGEGERPMLELADALERGTDVTSIANVHARVDGRVYENPIRPLSDLAGLPPMATDIWDFQRVTDLRRGWVNVSAQRGCPYRCTYCHNNGEAKLYARELGVRDSNTWYVRSRPPAEVVSELEGIRDRYAMHAFSFVDDTFTMDTEWLAELLPLYRDRVGVPFVCNTTAVDLDEDVVDALVDAGCRLVRMGVESGSERLRSRLLRRPFPESRLRWAFDAVQRAGMHALAFNMIGNVGETRAETEATFRFNAALRPTSMKLSLAHPYPGTDYDDASRAADAIDPDKHTHNFIRASILRRDAEEEAWLQKVSTFYFWFVNRHLDGEAGQVFGPLVDELEALPREEWAREDVRAAFWARHAEVSDALTRRGVFHYTTPFAERTDIVVSSLAVRDHAELIRRESAEPH